MSAHLALAECLLALAGMGACVWLFVLMKAELRGASRRSRNRAEAEKQTGLLVPPPATRSGFNLSKRSQAIRMSRRGETPSQIAAALELPQGEVDLLLKVHRLVVSLPVTTAAAKGP